MSVTSGTSMRGLVFDGPNCMTLRELPIPVPAAGEVLIRVHHAAICGSDVRIRDGRKTRDVRPGHPIGHECAGTVAAVGEGITDYTAGERVAVCVVVSCGQCAYCAGDTENLCETRITLGYHTDGAFADYMLIPAHAVARGNLFKLPESIPIDLAPLLEPMACCLNGQHEMQLGETTLSTDPAESLVIFGAGPIGLIHLLLARAKGLGPITVVEPQPHRRTFAQAFGADAVCSPEEFDAPAQFDNAILAAGVPGLVDIALRSVRKRGKVNLFAGFDVGSAGQIDPNLIHYGQITLTGASESRRGDYAKALSLVSTGRLDPTPLLTHRFKLADHETAFKMAASGEALKVAFDLTEPP